MTLEEIKVLAPEAAASETSRCYVLRFGPVVLQLFKDMEAQAVKVKIANARYMQSKRNCHGIH